MAKANVTVVDCGVGNLLSVCRALEYCGASVVLTSDPEKVKTASRLVLPGVGALANAMRSLRDFGLVSVIHEVAARGTPVLGICLGMQLLMEESEEFGITRALGIIQGKVVSIPAENSPRWDQKIPHIGWNELHPTESRDWNGTILHSTSPGDAVYFVHSFMAIPSDSGHCLAKCDYGGHRIPAVIQQGQTIGCQFHPEKSGEIGLQILRRFCSN